MKSIGSPADVWPPCDEAQWRALRNYSPNGKGGLPSREILPSERILCEKWSPFHTWESLKGTLGEYTLGCYLSIQTFSKAPGCLPLWWATAQRAPDLGKDIFWKGLNHQVKTTQRHDGNYALWATCASAQSQIYWLLSFAERPDRITIHGWIWADTFDYLADDFDGDFRVPAACLESPYELPCAKYHLRFMNPWQWLNRTMLRKYARLKAVIERARTRRDQAQSLHASQHMEAYSACHALLTTSRIDEALKAIRIKYPEMVAREQRIYDECEQFTGKAFLTRLPPSHLIPSRNTFSEGKFHGPMRMSTSSDLCYDLAIADLGWQCVNCKAWEIENPGLCWKCLAAELVNSED